MSDVDATVHDTSVPAVPAGAGPRMSVLIFVAVGALGLGFLMLTALGTPAPVANAVGLADTSTAQVTDRTFRSNTGYRTRGCSSYYDYDVAWGDREGHFSVCIQAGGPLVDLEVGDDVQVASVPWSSQVMAEGEAGATFWSMVGLASGLLLPTFAVLWVLRYRRIWRGTARGTRLTGRVDKQGRNAVSVFVDSPPFDDRRLVLLPAKHVMSLAPTDPAEVWATRRSLFRKRPRGPWVMRARGQLGVFSHAWWRRTR